MVREFAAAGSRGPDHVGRAVTALPALPIASVAPVVSRIERFLFEPINPRSAAVLRIALAMMLPYAFRSRGLAVFPPAASIVHALWWYHHLFLTTSYALLVIGVAALFGLGVRPRVTGLILFAMLLPLASLDRGRQSRQVWLFALLAFSLVRSDACWSFRTWLKPALRQSDAGPIWPIRLMQIQLSLVYAVNAIAKSTPHYLSGETLIAMSQMRPNFLVNLSDGYAHLGPIAMPAALAAISSVATESFLAVGFWFRRLRWLTAAVGVAFHIMLQSVVRIFMLDITSLFLYSIFLLPWSIARDAAGESDRSVARS
jgi:hypothetical protein